jgi:UDP-N-acetylglucosamine--N-acetylmuramyl-(pentapeptide) pyrophosphoryl-undecaprenol N-acetylglucosamine transferase
MGVKLEVTHVVGLGDLARTKSSYIDAGIHARVVPHIGDIAAAYRWADFGLVSGGAVTLAEVAAVGLPAFLVPNAATARDHQALNVRAFSAATGMPWVDENAWDVARIAGTVQVELISAKGWEKASRQVRGVARPDAAERLVARGLAALSGGENAPEGTARCDRLAAERVSWREQRESWQERMAARPTRSRSISKTQSTQQRTFPS